MTRASISYKKDAKEFTLLRLLKVVSQDVATKKHFGQDPLTGEDEWFAAKPASVRFRMHALEELKDAPV